MKADDWASLACSPDEWTTKRHSLISELNALYGDKFASVNGDFIRLTAKDGRRLDLGAVSQTEYRVGNQLDSGNRTGTPIAGDKLIYHIGSFVKGSARTDNRS